MPRWQQRPPGSNWGDFGGDDVLGRLNLIGAEQVRKGIDAVEEDRVFSLSLPLDRPGGTVLNPNRFPPVVRPSLRSGEVNFNCSMSVAIPGASDVMSDDLVVLHTQYSTQWDAFLHAGALFDADGDWEAEQVYYNGWCAGTDVVGPESSESAGISSLGRVEGASEGAASTSDAGPVGISHMARHGVQGRAVLVDLEAHLGAQRTIVGFDEFAQVLQADRIAVEPGDILVLHTGFARALVETDTRPTAEQLNVGAVLDGSDYSARRMRRVRGYLIDLLLRIDGESSLRPGIDLVHEATWLVALWDGLQLQWLCDPDSVDLGAHLREHVSSLLG